MEGGSHPTQLPPGGFRNSKPAFRHWAPRHQHQQAKHLLTSLVLIHPAIVKQMTPNLQVRGAGGGGLLDHIGENLEQKLSSEKRLRDLGIDKAADFKLHGWNLDYGAGPWSLEYPWSFLSSACSSMLRVKRGGPPDLRLGGAASSWGALSSRKPCPLQITEVLCYAQSFLFLPVWD